MITFVVNEVLAIPELNMNPINTIELNRFCNKIEHLTKQILFPKDDDNKVSIIIGRQKFATERLQ